MIDLKAARADPDRFRTALSRRGAADAFDRLMEADARWRELVPAVDELRAKQKLDGKPTPEQLEGLRALKEELRAQEEALAAAEAARDEALRQVPNIPDPSAAEGMREEDAVEVKRVGEPPRLDEPKEHLELGRFEMERAARLSGSRFGFMVGDTARLAFALYRWALDVLVEKGFTPMIPPVLVREEAMYGTGFFPSDKADYYEIPTDGLYLIGTSEVPLAGFHMGELLEEDLPLRYCAYSSCFRRESGAAGRDTRGMFRRHQFEKVEMFAWTRPENSPTEHDWMLAIEEELVGTLGLPYRVVNTAAGDLSAAAAKRYDIEAWFPSQERYREITSCSNTTDFQARRMGVRFRSDGRLETPHTLNGTAATDRWLLAILENFQGEVPEVLRQHGAPAHVQP